MIKVGDRVRSFDFPDRWRDLTGPNACYVEGTVVGFASQDCRRYEIKVERHVFSGREMAGHAEFVFPPVNGTECLFGGTTNGVEKI